MRDGDKKVNNVHVKQVVDESGNFVREEKDWGYRFPVEPEFVKMYVDDVASLNHIAGIQGVVLAYMATLMDYDNKVVLSASERKRWQLEHGVAQSTINNAISCLLRDGHIFKSGSGEYTVNPTLFSKGDWKKTMQKRESFEAHFTVSYERTKAGYTRTFREAKVKPIAMRINLETGKPEYKYKKRGQFEEKRHNDTDVVESRIEIDDEDISY